MMDNAAGESNPLIHAESGNFGDSGTFIPGVPRQRKLKSTIFGKRQDFRDIKCAEWVFMAVTVLSAGFMLAFSIQRIVAVESRAKHDPISPELVMLTAEAFAIYYICHGVIYKRSHEIVIYFIAIICDDAYCTYDFCYRRDFSPYPIFRLTWDWGMGLAVPLLLVYCCYSKREEADFNRFVSRLVGREDLQRDLKRLFWLHSLLVLDLQFAMSSVIFILTERKVDLEDALVLGLGIIVNVVFFSAGKYDIRRERHRGTFVFLTLAFFPFFFLLFKIAKQIDGLRAGYYLDVASILFSSLSAGVRGAILVLSYLIIARYGNGLKNRIFEEPENVELSASRGGARNASEANNI